MEAVQQEAWCMKFPALSGLTRLRHAFTLRHPHIGVKVDREQALARLLGWHLEIVRSLGFSRERLALAEQVHGDGIAVLEAGTAAPVGGVDGLITATPGVMLGIYVADCCAVHLVDPETGAIGLLHSGRKGSELGITAKAIALMRQRFGVRPEHLLVQLSPCIRPPVYEVDFAARIREQAMAAGVPEAQVLDEGVCTSDVSRFYSYRVEKGKTGRMMALLGNTGGGH